MKDSPYYKNTLSYKFYGRSFEFAVSQELFSSVGIDKGTELLLRTIAEAEYKGVASALDIGSGYGALGIPLTALYPEIQLTLVDRDRLAVEFSEYNLKANKITGVSYASLGFDSVQTNEFDLIVSNLPGKASIGVLTDLLDSARYFAHLKTVVAIVVVAPIAEEIATFLEENEDIAILKRKDSRAYSVFHFAFKTKALEKRAQFQPAFARGVYKRGVMSHPKLTSNLETVYGLPEFESLHFKTKMLLEVIQKDSLAVRGHAVGIWNPLQGFIPVVLQAYQPVRLRIMSRDQLSLKACEKNLKGATSSVEYKHITLPSYEGLKTVFINLHERDNIKAVVSGMEHMPMGQRVYIVGKVSQLHQVSQLIRRLPNKVSLAEVARHKGFACIKVSV